MGYSFDKKRHLSTKSSREVIIMERADEEIIRAYEEQIGRPISEKAMQLFELHIQEVQKSYQQGYAAGQALAHK